MKLPANEYFLRILFMLLNVFIILGIYTSVEDPIPFALISGGFLLFSTTILRWIDRILQN